MVVSRAATVPQYLDELGPDRRPSIERLLALARRRLKGYAEGMRYGMIYFESPSGDGLGIASQRHFIGLYIGEARLAAHRAELLGQDMGKGCWRFPRPDRIDWKLVERVLS